MTEKFGQFKDETEEGWKKELVKWHDFALRDIEDLIGGGLTVIEKYNLKKISEQLAQEIIEHKKRDRDSLDGPGAGPGEIISRFLNQEYGLYDIDDYLEILGNPKDSDEFRKAMKIKLKDLISVARQERENLEKK